MYLFSSKSILHNKLYSGFVSLWVIHNANIDEAHTNTQQIKTITFVLESIDFLFFRLKMCVFIRCSMYLEYPGPNFVIFSHDCQYESHTNV